LFEEGNSKQRQISFVSNLNCQESDDESCSDKGKHDEQLNSMISSDLEKFFSAVCTFKVSLEHQQTTSSDMNTLFL
jgi:hypothetical protein